MTAVVIPVYNEVTQLDFTAPHQFLTMIPDITVIAASIGAAPVTSHGLSFAKLADLETIGSCDVLCVPGGLGCIDAMEDVRFLSAGCRRPHARTAGKVVTSAGRRRCNALGCIPKCCAMNSTVTTPDGSIRPTISATDRTADTSRPAKDSSR